ncbi:MAG: hypothetical protein Q8936_21585 [Bacillota bacterium]|nr:hypothetical protein [Bacillota bacterium]
MKPFLDVSVEFLSKDKDYRERKFYLNGSKGYSRGYSPHFRVIGDSEFLGIEFIEGPDRFIGLGEMVNAKVELMYYPDVSYEKLIKGQRFEILEGATVVGRGYVLSAVKL